MHITFIIIQILKFIIQTPNSKFLFHSMIDLILTFGNQVLTFDYS
jgi:hypothetical protein